MKQVVGDQDMPLKLTIRVMFLVCLEKLHGSFSNWVRYLHSMIKICLSLDWVRDLTVVPVIYNRKYGS